MLNNSKVETVIDQQASMSNLRLLLLSDKKSLFGDPYFGTNLKKTFFSQNGVILKDLVIDEIYTAIIQFMPQLALNRNDITINQWEDEIGSHIEAQIKATNLLSKITDMYTIRLIEGQ